MDNKGYIPISRALFDGGNEFWSEEREYSRFEAWLDLIQLARFDNGVTHIRTYEKVSLNRGQLVGALSFLMSRWKWGEKKVRGFLKYLESEKMIVREPVKGKVGTVITLCNYDRYNPVTTKKGELKGEVRTKKGRSEGDNIKKDKKDKKGKKDPPIIPQSGDGDFSFCDPEFLPAFQGWLEYKKQRRESYKSHKSIIAAYNKLVELSGNDSDTAGKVIEQSMANNWAGLFELKTSNNGKSKSRETGNWTTSSFDK